MRKILLFLLLLMLMSGTGISQVPEPLKSKIAGKTKLADIMKEVDIYYKDERERPGIPIGQNGEEFENDYLRWKRWEYYQSGRLDADGSIIPNLNRKIYDGLNNYLSERQQTNNSSAVQSSYGSWSPFGPTTITTYGAGYSAGYGRVNCIAFHPTSPNTLIIGTPQGGIWKTFNNGASWFILSNNLPSNGISGLVWDRTNSNIIYALTGDGDEGGISGFVTANGYLLPSLGVFKSVDGGNSWQATGDFPSVTGNFYGYKLIQHPVDANTLFAATSIGIYKTIDGGNNWLLVQPGSFTDLEFKPGDPSIMYAAEFASSAPFWRSTNSGDNWVTASTGLTASYSRIAIAVSANQPDYIYVISGGVTASGSFKGLFRSTVAGIPSFTLRSNTPNIHGGTTNGADNRDQSDYDLAFEADPLNANTIITGGINIWKSTDGGVSYGGSSRTNWISTQPGLDYVHADVHNLTYNPLNNYLYCVTDGGVGFSSNNGTNWTFIPNNLGILASYHGDWYEANPDYLVCGAQDNGTTVKYSATSTYRHIYGGDGFDCVIKDNDPNTIVFVVNEVLYKTTNGGSTSTYVTPVEPFLMGFFPQLARDYNTNTRIYAGGTYYLHRSNDFGSTWTNIDPGIYGPMKVLTTCPSNSDRLYLSNGTTLRRSDDATTTLSFTTKSSTPGYPSGLRLTDLESRPSNSLYVYGSFGGYTAGEKVYYSADGGDNWTNFSGSLPNVACHSIAVDASNTVYVGTDIGVFVRSVSMSDWQPFYNYLPRTPVSELMVNNTSGRIIACTFGHGNFYSDLYSSCPPNLNITGSLLSGAFYEASSTIVSTATATQGAGNNAALKAGDYVRLDPGFEVKNSSMLRAYINPCNTGGVPFTEKNLQDISSTENLYVPAKNGVRFATAKILDIYPDKTGAEIEILKEGDYAARVTDINGNVIDLPFLQKRFTPGIAAIRWNRSFPHRGQYYIQLFRENELVHFLEFDVQ